MREMLVSHLCKAMIGTDKEVVAGDVVVVVIRRAMGRDNLCTLIPLMLLL